MGSEVRGVPQIPGRVESVTVTTVAKLAGVSTATVSRVLAGRQSVDPLLAARVRQAVEELDFRPNAAARVLASGRHRNIAVIIPDAANPYFFEVIDAILTSAAKDGYRILIADSRGDADEELEVALGLVGQVDGIILVSPRLGADGLRRLARERVPVLLANRVEVGVELPMVAVDNFTAMLEICGHLADLGHRDVAYLGGSPLAWQNEERWRAIRSAGSFGIRATRIAGDGTIEDGRAGAEQALRLGVTALICFNDLTALGAISKLRDLRISVPGDVSVTGFDDIDLARYSEIPITTAASPKRRLGARLWRSMFETLESGTRVSSVDSLAAPVIVRSSTGPVRPAPVP